MLTIQLKTQNSVRLTPRKPKFKIRNFTDRLISIVLLALCLLSWAFPVQAAVFGSKFSGQYAPPPSYSNAELADHDFSGQSLRVAEFSNTNLNRANFTHADLTGAVMSASTMTETNFQGADLTQAMLDQVKMVRTDLRNAILANTILLRSTFEAVDITGADFSEAILDGAQMRQLCQVASGVNAQTGVPTRDSLGCRS